MVGSTGLSCGTCAPDLLAAVTPSPSPANPVSIATSEGSNSPPRAALPTSDVVEIAAVDPILPGIDLNPPTVENLAISVANFKESVVENPGLLRIPSRPSGNFPMMFPFLSNLKVVQ